MTFVDTSKKVEEILITLETAELQNDFIPGLDWTEFLYGEETAEILHEEVDWNEFMSNLPEKETNNVTGTPKVTFEPEMKDFEMENFEENLGTMEWNGDMGLLTNEVEKDMDIWTAEMFSELEALPPGPVSLNLHTLSEEEVEATTPTPHLVNPLDEVRYVRDGIKVVRVYQANLDVLKEVKKIIKRWRAPGSGGTPRFTIEKMRLESGENISLYGVRGVMKEMKKDGNKEFASKRTKYIAKNKKM